MLMDSVPEPVDNEGYLPRIGIDPGIRSGRILREGCQRASGLQWGDLPDHVRADPLFVEALKLAKGRTLIPWPKLMNIFLILKFFLPRNPKGDIVEFGSFRCGGAMFMARVCRELYPDVRVFALDTFAGMPETDRAVDTFRQGSFANLDYDEVVEAVRAADLPNLTLVRGLFEDTIGDVLEQTSSVALTHIDCDIYSAVAFSYNAIKPRLTKGAYIVFDDATESGCIGATEAVERFVVQRDGLFSEQVYPHLVYRHGL